MTTDTVEAWGSGRGVDLSSVVWRRCCTLNIKPAGLAGDHVFYERMKEGTRTVLR